MNYRLKQLCLSACISLLFFNGAVADESATLSELFKALEKKAWPQAREIANEIDAKNQNGDIMLAFTDSVEAINNGNCTTAKELSNLVIDQTPGFLPAYDVLANCLIVEGQQSKASSLYQSLADNLREGPEQEIAQRKADNLKPDLSPSLAFDFSITPSTNTSRRTSRTTIGNGGVLTDDSRAQDGVTISSGIQLIKPIFNSHRMLSQVSLKLGGRYNTVTSTVLPLVGGEIRNTWLLSNKTSVYAAPFYEYTWRSGDRFFDEYGLRLGGNFILDQTKQLSVNFIISERDFTDTGRDSTFLLANLNQTTLIDERNRINYTFTALDIDSDNPFFNIRDYSAGIELETAHENGFITSLGGIVGTRKYDRNASATSEIQSDDYYSISFGLSHSKIVFNKIRPEVVYNYTNQSSNNLLDDFSAHDIGLKLKANY